MTTLFYEPVKRAIDLGVASVALAASAPALVVAAVAVRVHMGTPVLFRQQRPGRGARPFTLLKLRTMRPPRPDEDLVASDGHRLTRLGRFLRATSLDELPTLINVLRGDMSLVGPRPLLWQYLERYTPEQARRHEVKPGITGWAQIQGRNLVSHEDKFRLDVWYVDNRSLSLDLRILIKTLELVARRQGITHGGAATMPEWRGSNAGVDGGSG